MSSRQKLIILVTSILLAPSPVFAESKIEKDVVIGMVSGLALVMDVHHPENPNGYAIVHVSGSGFRRPLSYDAPQLSESQVRIFGAPLVEQGYTIFSLNHRAIPKFEISEAVLDVQRAVRYVRYHADDYGIEPNHIGAVGGSSGGYLVSMLGLLDGNGDPEDRDPINQVSGKVQTVLARAPVTDFARMDPDSDRVTEASPIDFVSRDDPPLLLLHGDVDETVPFEQSEVLLAALEQAGVAAHLIIIPNAGHGPTFPGAVNPPDYIGAMIEWFDGHLKK
jgi:acetyl esterase/lipase|tara:strand:- start:5418 stop:6251 length:834 start_codon:yes stop_codon:yes gene_type:complete